MSVTMRGSSWQATVHHQGARLRRNFATKSEAEAWELQTKASLMRGEPIQGMDQQKSDHPYTLKQLFELTYKRFWQGSKAEKTSSINALKCIAILGENLSPAAVTEQRIDDLVFQFEKSGVSDSTINRRLSAISKMLTFAHERGYIARRPKIERRKEPEHRIRFITHEEESKLLNFFANIQQPDVADFVIIGIDTGLRAGEILRLEARDIQQNVLTVWKSKSGKPRGIPLTQRAQEVLKRRSTEHPTGVLFPQTYDSFRHYWDLARRHMGLMTDEQFVIHAMRHTFCSRLVMAGVDIVTVSKLAGHSTIMVTMRYVHLAPNTLFNAINTMEQAAGVNDAEVDAIAKLAS